MEFIYISLPLNILHYPIKGVPKIGRLYIRMKVKNEHLPCISLIIKRHTITTNLIRFITMLPWFD